MSSHHGGHYQPHDEEEQPVIDWRTKPIVKPDFAAGSKPKPKNEYNIISGGDVAHAGQKSPPPKPEKGNFQKGFNIISWAEKPVAYQAKK